MFCSCNSCICIFSCTSCTFYFPCCPLLLKSSATHNSLHFSSLFWQNLLNHSASVTLGTGFHWMLCASTEVCGYVETDCGNNGVNAGEALVLHAKLDTQHYHTWGHNRTDDGAHRNRGAFIVGQPFTLWERGPRTLLSVQSPLKTCTQFDSHWRRPSQGCRTETLPKHRLVRKQAPSSPEEQRQESGELTASGYKDENHQKQTGQPKYLCRTLRAPGEFHSGPDSKGGHIRRSVCSIRPLHVWHAESKLIDWFTKAAYDKCIIKVHSLVCWPTFPTESTDAKYSKLSPLLLNTSFMSTVIALKWST